MTLAERIQAGQCPTFARLCAEISSHGYPEQWYVSRTEWQAVQMEMNRGYPKHLLDGKVMGVPLKILTL